MTGAQGTCGGRRTIWAYAPLLAVAAAFGLGAHLGEGEARDAAALLATSGVGLALAYAAPRARGARWALCAAALGLGAAGAMVERLTYESSTLRRWVSARASQGPQPVLLEGRLGRDPDIAGDGWLLVLKVTSARAEGAAVPLVGRARVYVEGHAPRPALIEGDRIRVWTQLSLPRGRQNPGAFDSVAHLFRRGVHVIGSCKSAALIEAERRDPGLAPASAVPRLRDAVRRRLIAELGEGPAASVVRAMVLGDRAGLSDETEEAFRVAGTYHVLALSGAQVALVTGLLLGALRLLRAPPALAALVGGGAVTLYAFFVGGDVPVARAAVMAVVLLLGLALSLKGQAANLLGAAALVLLGWRPSAIADASFQLSFAATLAIIWLVPLLTPVFGGLPRPLALLLAGSLAAQIGVLPLMAYHFHRLAPAGLLLNLIAVPAASIVLVAGFCVALTAGWAPPVAWLSGQVAGLSAEAMLRSSAWAGVIPGADVRVMTPAIWLLVAYASAVLTVALRPTRRRAATLVLASVIVGLAVGTRAPVADGRLHLTVLDVGSGDSLVVQSPQGRTLLVDTGGSRMGEGPDVGETVVAPYLWWCGTRALDGLALTHPHSDHTGGAGFLAGHFRVGELWTSAARGSYAPAAATRRRAIGRGFVREWDGVQIEALWPPEAAGAGLTDNEASLVLLLRYGDVRYLLTGDIGAASERQLRPVALDVLKVAHHGSRLSGDETFLDATRPRVAIVSCGAGGFGPRPETLARYRRHGTLVFRTDMSGAVTAITDGHRLWVGPATGPLSVLADRPSF